MTHRFSNMESSSSSMSWSAMVAVVHVEERIEGGVSVRPEAASVFGEKWRPLLRTRETGVSLVRGNTATSKV